MLLTSQIICFIGICFGANSVYLQEDKGLDPSAVESKELNRHKRQFGWDITVEDIKRFVKPIINEKMLNISRLEPFLIESQTVDLKKEAVTVKVKTTVHKVKGLSNFDIKNINVKKSSLDITLQLQKVVIKGNYFLDGKVMNTYSANENGTYRLIIEGLSLSASISVTSNDTNVKLKKVQNITNSYKKLKVRDGGKSARHADENVIALLKSTFDQSISKLNVYAKNWLSTAFIENPILINRKNMGDQELMETSLENSFSDVMRKVAQNIEKEVFSAKATITLNKVEGLSKFSINNIYSEDDTIQSKGSPADTTRVDVTLSFTHIVLAGSYVITGIDASPTNVAGNYTAEINGVDVSTSLHYKFDLDDSGFLKLVAVEKVTISYITLKLRLENEINDGITNLVRLTIKNYLPQITSYAKTYISSIKGLKNI